MLIKTQLVRESIKAKFANLTRFSRLIKPKNIAAGLAAISTQVFAFTGSLNTGQSNVDTMLGSSGTAMGWLSYVMWAGIVVFCVVIGLMLIFRENETIMKHANKVLVGAAVMAMGPIIAVKFGFCL